MCTLVYVYAFGHTTECEANYAMRTVNVLVRIQLNRTIFFLCRLVVCAAQQRAVSVRERETLTVRLNVNIRFTTTNRDFSKPKMIYSKCMAFGDLVF